jgi:hypothetical protein
MELQTITILTSYFMLKNRRFENHKENTMVIWYHCHSIREKQTQTIKKKQ